MCTNNKKLIIVGAGGHGKVCADIAILQNTNALLIEKWSEISFLDNGVEGIVNNIKVLKDDAILSVKNHDIFVAIGNNQKRKEIITYYKNKGFNIINLIHPQSFISNNVIIGKGTVVMPGVIINSNAKIGDGVILNTSSIIEHDSFIGNYSHISPGAVVLGEVNIGKLVWVGGNSTIKNGISITNNTVIGMGSKIINDIKTSGTYINNGEKLKEYE